MADKFTTYIFPKIGIAVDSESSGFADRNILAHQSSEDRVLVIERESYNEGFAQGYEQSLKIEKSKSEPFLEVLGKASAILKEHRRWIQENVQKDIVTVAIVLAGMVIDHETSNNTPLGHNIIQNALKISAGNKYLKIKIHPEDDPYVRKMIENQSVDTGIATDVEYCRDRGIQKGGCLIETDFGIIDARIDQQLVNLTQELNAITVGQCSENNTVDINEKRFEIFHQVIQAASPIKPCGSVKQVVGLVVEANGPVVQLGCMCDIYGKENEQPVMAEVLGFRDSTVLMMPLEDIRSIGPGSRVVARQQNALISVGNQLLGRIIDGLGNPIDGLGAFATNQQYPIYANPINPLLRQRICKPLDMGVRAINGLLCVGCGQRMGIFAGSGVGKSTLMGMIARKSSADVNVIALIGERGRELNEFIEKELGEEGRKKSVVVVATSDHLPLVRVRGAFVATAIAEYFRDQGLNVNLMMDSITRFAMAQREIGLALGEPPTTKGYTPSVFTLLPKLLERAGTSDHNGTITGLYTVLVEGDDMNEPIADAARSILDGHIVLTRELADQNHYPAIDVLKSVSRVMDDIAALQHKHNAGRFKEMLAIYRKSEDLINIGAYVSGSNPKIDRAISKIDQMNKYMRQDIRENIDFEVSLQQLEKIMAK